MEQTNLCDKSFIICDYCQIEVPQLTIIIQIDGAYIFKSCNCNKDTEIIPVLNFINDYYKKKDSYYQNKCNHISDEKSSLFFCKNCNSLFCKNCILIHNKFNQNHFNDLNNLMKCKIHLKKYIKYNIKEKKNVCEDCIKDIEDKKSIINYSDYLNEKEIENKMNTLIELYEQFKENNYHYFYLIYNEMKDIENKDNYLRVLRDSLNYNNEVNNYIINFLKIIKQEIRKQNLQYNTLFNFKENSQYNNYSFSFDYSNNVLEKYSFFNEYLRNNFIIKTKLLYSPFNHLTFNNESTKYSKHKESIDCIIQLTDKRIVTGSQDKTIKFYDDKKYNIIHSIYVNDSGVYSLNELQNKKLVSGSENGEIKIWNVIYYYQLILSIKLYNNPIWGFMNFNEDKFIVISENPIIKIFNINTFDNIEFNSEESILISLLILKDNRFLIGSLNGNVKIYNLNNLKIIRTLKGHSQGVNYIYELHDGRIATASSDNTIKIWNSLSGKLLFTFTGHQSNVETLLQEKNSLLVSGSWDFTIKFWDIFKYECIFNIEINGEKFLCIWPIKNEGFVSSGFDFNICVWKREKEKASCKIVILND